MPADSETRRTDPKYDNLSDLLLDSLFAGANLDLERSKDRPRRVSEYNRPGGLTPASSAGWKRLATNRSSLASSPWRKFKKVSSCLPKGSDAPNSKAWLKRDLQAWFSDRVLSVDRPVAARWASLMAQAHGPGDRCQPSNADLGNGAGP